MRRASVLFASLAVAMAVAPAAASASAASITSLGSCDAHYANTAAWANCSAGSQTSWVRLGYNCGVGPLNRDYHSDWFVLEIGRSFTINAECSVRVNGAWYNVRPY